VFRFFATFIVLLAVLFGAELTPFAQQHFVIPWTNALAAVSAWLVTVADPSVAATVVAEMLSNRLEESLNREEFEEGLRQTVAATENAIETGMIAVLHEHVEGWYADIVNPVHIIQ